MLTLKHTRPTLTHCHMRTMRLLGQQKKNGTWTRMERCKSTQQIAQAEHTGPCKRKFSSVDDHDALPCNKKQVLNDDELSTQMVEAVEQPRQKP